MVSIPTNLKYFLVLITTFVVVYWFQLVDDKKRCKERTNIYEKIKLPLLVSAIVGLVLLWNNESFTAIFVTSNIIQEINPEIPDISIKPDINMKPEMNFISKNLPVISQGQPDFEVYTGLPEW